MVPDGPQRAVWLEVRLDGEVMDNLAWITLDEQGHLVAIVDFWPEPSPPAPHRPAYVERW